MKFLYANRKAPDGKLHSATSRSVQFNNVPQKGHHAYVDFNLIFLSNYAGGCVPRRLFEPRHPKPTMWFSNRSDTNRAVQAQKMARSLKVWI